MSTDSGSEECKPSAFDVFNLEFPSWCGQLEIRGYKVLRVDDYGERLLRLQHLLNVQSEFSCKMCNGEHQVTASVTVASQEEPSVFFSGRESFTELDDILLLLSLLTCREVVTVRGMNESGSIQRRSCLSEKEVLQTDPREFRFASGLRTSVAYEKTAGGIAGRHFDGGIQKALQATMDLTRSPEWQKRNADGHFLRIFKDAVSASSIEASFTYCWTMWEHLFAVRNRSWINPKSQISAKEKVLFIVTQILELSPGDKLPARVGELVQVRNRLVHFGALPESEKRDDVWYRKSAKLFIELSAQVVVRLLQLGEGSNILNTKERLAHWVETGEHPDFTQ